MATGDPSYHQVANNEGAAGAGAGEGGEGGQQQMPSVFETLRSVAVRAMIFYAIMSFFRKPQQQGAPGPDGSPSPARAAAMNLYSEGMGFDLYVYISEQDDFNDFNVRLYLVVVSYKF